MSFKKGVLDALWSIAWTEESAEIWARLFDFERAEKGSQVIGLIPTEGGDVLPRSRASRWVDESKDVLRNAVNTLRTFAKKHGLPVDHQSGWDLAVWATGRPGGAVVDLPGYETYRAKEAAHAGLGEYRMVAEIAWDEIAGDYGLYGG